MISKDHPMISVRSTFVDHRVIIGRTRQETTWTYRGKDGEKKVKYRKERWRVRNPDGTVTNKAHYIGRIEDGNFIPARAETLRLDERVAV